MIFNCRTVGNHSGRFKWLTWRQWRGTWRVASWNWGWRCNRDRVTLRCCNRSAIISRKSWSSWRTVMRTWNLHWQTWRTKTRWCSVTRIRVSRRCTPSWSRHRSSCYPRRPWVTNWVRRYNWSRRSSNLEMYKFGTWMGKWISWPSRWHQLNKTWRTSKIRCWNKLRSLVIRITTSPSRRSWLPRCLKIMLRSKRTTIRICRNVVRGWTRWR